MVSSWLLHPVRRFTGRSMFSAALSAMLAGVVAVATTFAFLLPAAPACARASVQPQQRATLSASAVAAPDRYSAETAQRIFAEGGNAVDAAVAITFTLAVTYPEAGNIGGGGFMTLFFNGKPYFLDYRERAPLAATRTMYLDAQGAVIHNKNLYGAAAAGVPGIVEGMWQVQRRFGKLSWQQVLAPAIGYARDGFLPDEQLIRRCNIVQQRLAGQFNFASWFAGMQANVNFRQPQLAQTLTRLAHDGESDFYRGKTARLIVATMHSQGNGLITAQDLAQYQAVWRAPIEADWKGFRIITAPPPSSGGIGLVQMLSMKADLAPLFEGVKLDSAIYVHRIAEIEKRVFADRAQYLGDPDFYQVPVAQLLDDAYLKKRAAQVNPNSPSESASVLPGLGGGLPVRVVEEEKPQTTHFSVVDKWGNAVSSTCTLNGYFGSGVVVEGAGFLLNDEMDDFSSKPSVANRFGVVGSEANAIEPGKRPLSSMTPTILTRDGKVALVIGTPSGSRIFTTIFQVITDLVDHHLSLTDAVAAMRFHHQLLPPNTIFWEPSRAFDADLAAQLQAMGYVLHPQDFSGDVQAIMIEGNRPVPVADPRGRGVARVIP